MKLIPITTPSWTFNVWTKRVGSNPRIKVPLLHGGPGATHGYYYDQPGSALSDQPKDPSLWGLPRFVEEVDHGRF